MNLKRIIKEEINDFDWVKEINPIQCKDLKGYYFYHGEVKNNDPFIRKFVIEDVFIKNPRGYGRGDDLDSLKIYYTWRDRTTYDWNQMECDTFIHRVKTGDYTLYDKNGVKVNPRDLAYTDGTFDDERKEIWEQDESDDFDWIRTTVPTVWIGGKNDYPVENVPLGTKVVTPKGDVFTIEDITGGHQDFQWVWGSDAERPWLGPKNYDVNKNWHNALWLRKFEE